jgi:hypothetical protein
MILGVGLENVFVPFKKLATNRKQTDSGVYIELLTN